MRVVAFIIGLILLLPGMCVLAVGGTKVALLIGFAILGAAVCMFWVAFLSGDPPDADARKD